MKDAVISWHMILGTTTYLCSLAGSSFASLYLGNGGGLFVTDHRNESICWKHGYNDTWRSSPLGNSRVPPCMSSLARLRAIIGQAMRETKDGVKTVLFKVSNKGELIAAAMVSVTVGLLLNPFSVLDACFESELYSNKKPESAHSPRSARHDSSKLGQAYREVCPKWNTKTNKLSGHHEESYVFECGFKLLNDLRTQCGRCKRSPTKLDNFNNFTPVLRHIPGCP
ncbi:hypothetical protein F5141DRAFT_1205796 [Pisolithus sp. B1]|nr:hypothetical protein F5141DRAFT_1205796 [Pisolithus sp. B1]